MASLMVMLIVLLVFIGLGWLCGWLATRLRTRKLGWIILAALGLALLVALVPFIIAMVQMFQAMEIYGEADPQLMAGAISEALTNTILQFIVIGPSALVTAIVLATRRNRRQRPSPQAFD